MFVDEQPTTLATFPDPGVAAIECQGSPVLEPHIRMERAGCPRDIAVPIDLKIIIGSVFERGDLIEDVF